ncbi:hypothetical protein GMES_3201 [Paraglaciecola mesophila KMM 241]|uniref:Uncharacterized protein n=1 Tax=Paraglaciecola mesophila KMM 241 TaxID=1128912 RepID=K6XY03_9ALTE|nr:hypothetical protein GMES_3201 [Paraglaciecola mesophila KMM 241]
MEYFTVPFVRKMQRWRNSILDTKPRSTAVFFILLKPLLH